MFVTSGTSIVVTAVRVSCITFDTIILDPIFYSRMQPPVRMDLEVFNMTDLSALKDINVLRNLLRVLNLGIVQLQLNFFRNALASHAACKK